NVASIYFNGRLAQQSIINVADFASANIEDFWIGRMFGSATIWYPYNGVIDDVTLYNYALPQSEIDNLFGGYIDPSLDDYVIYLDSLVVGGNTCNGLSGGTLHVYPDNY